jgi:hypothetical protein
MVMFMKAALKKVNGTDTVYIDGRMATSIGVFMRMINFMAVDGSSFIMGLAHAWNMRTEY